ncbi:unnamed protein product [Toxocara canis]|uniref:Uncharacterized protein n=1 Tax=Toxocara canis TaxID=6265 RepID=A0A183URU2_TOXCA|nr:unnamed protein product [Toxocara canis]
MVWRLDDEASEPSESAIVVKYLLHSCEKLFAFFWWKPQNQYYTFHPKLLCREVSAVDDKPSVLEMEHSYLLKHRAAQQWPPMSQSTRGRLEQYVRNRCTSVDEQTGVIRGGTLTGLSSRPVLPASLARIRTEDLCSTRSEPDLRPMALDDYSCRYILRSSVLG